MAYTQAAIYVDGAGSPAILAVNEKEMNNETAPRAIAIFVKTPGLSPIKTRLANNIGEENAMVFYKHAVACVAALCNDLPKTDVFWAVAEQDGINRWPAFEALWTGEGELGERQHNIYSRLRRNYRKVMLIGADCPQFTPDDIEAGFESLLENDFAMGKASDGGYTYFAGKKSVPEEIWTRVKYSQPDTRGVLRRGLRGQYTEMGQHTDVDELPDLTKMLFEMPRDKTEAQRKICDWARELLKKGF